MTTEEQLKFSRRYARFNGPPQSLLGKLLTLIAGGAFLVLAFMFSLVALAIVAVGAVGLWGWLWWKTRAVRKQMREQMGEQMRNPAASATSAGRDGYIIEGEVIREESSPSRPERLLR